MSFELHTSAVAQVLPWFWPAVGGLLGAVLASFVCVVGERVPTGRSVGGRSACVCGRMLRPWENIPVAGWLLARGRARCCGAAIPTRYVTLEAAAGAASALAMLPPWPLIGVVGALIAVQGVVLAFAWQR